MLQIVVPEREQFNSATQEFVYTKECTLTLEHSLVSLSKWEAKWCKPFLSTEEHTVEETIDYIKCMTINSGVDPNVYLNLTRPNLDEIKKYTESPQTATWFSKDKGGRRSREVITSELIYYWMVALNIPFECQKWHLNRLFTLIRVCNIKNQPPKKRSTKDLLRSNAALNAARRERMGSKG